MNTVRRIWWAALISCGLMCTGCIHHIGGANLPTRGWEATPADPAMLKTAVPSRPTLRLFACHSFWYGDHAALWVGSPSGLWAFWDPAGWLADDYKWKDKDDVICRPFDLDFYWRWRSEDYDGLDMLVFEWDISEREARRVHRLLTSGCYTTWTPPGVCCVNVCNFVHTYLPYICAPPPPFHAFPGFFGEQLWSQDPDRVIVYHKCRRTVVYRKSGTKVAPTLPAVPTAALLRDGRPVPVVTAAAHEGLPPPGTLLPMGSIAPLPR